MVSVKLSSVTSRKNFYALRKTIGSISQFLSMSSTAKLFNIGKPLVRYWRKRFQISPVGSWGGKRWSLFNDQDQKLVEEVIFLLVSKKPDTTLGEIRAKLVKDFTLNVSETWLCKLFSRWGFSWRTPETKQLAKFSPTNNSYYIRYLCNLASLDVRKLKYVDESAFTTKTLRARQAIGKKDTRTKLVTSDYLDETLSMVLLTKYSDETYPIVFSLKNGTNTQIEFVEFILFCMDSGHLVHGDVLICDNATIHFGCKTFEALELALKLTGMTLMFLPTYSPELNPCELVFGTVKHYLRHKRDRREPFFLKILRASLEITSSKVQHFYDHCHRVLV